MRRKRNCFRVAVVCLLCVVCSLALPTSNSSHSKLPTANAPTSLELVADDLHRVGRVTNAIFLQSEALRKTINVRELIADSLGVGVESLSRMLAIDADSVVQVFEELHKRSIEAMRSAPLQADYINVRKINRYFEKGIDALGDEQNYAFDPESFVSAVDDTQEDNNLYVCGLHVDVGDLVSNWNDLRQPNHRNRSRLVASAVLRNLRKQFEDVVECFEHMKNYGDNDKSMAGTLSALEAFEDVNSFLVSFAKNFRLMKAFPGNIGVMKEDFRRFGPHWNDWQTTNVTKKVYDLLVALEKTQSDVVTAKKLTAGFENVQEMSQIVDDVRSNWFRKHIAKGKDTEELAKALDPFKKFGEKMKKVGEEFQKISSYHYKSNRTLNGLLKRGKKEIKILDSYPKWSSIEKDLTENERALRECWNGTKRIKYKYTEDLHNVFIAENELRYLVAEMERMTAEFVNTTDFKATNASFRRFRKILDTAGTIDQDNAFVLIQKLKAKKVSAANLAFEKLAGIVTQERVLGGLVERIYRITKHANVEDFDMRDKIEAANINKLFECLMSGSGASYNVNQVYDYHKVMTSVHWMKTNYEEFSKFFKAVSSLQKYVREAEDVASKIGKSRTRRAARGAADLVLKFNNSETFAHNLGSGVHVLYEINEVGLKRELFSRKLTPTASKIIASSKYAIIRKVWNDQVKDDSVRKMMSRIDKLISYCASIRGKSLEEMVHVFKEASKIQGILLTKKSLVDTQYQMYDAREMEASEDFKKIYALPSLDFASRRTSLSGAATTLPALQKAFDDFFGNGPNSTQTVSLHHYSGPSIIVVVVICVGVFVLILVTCVVGYGFTKNGKKKYKNMYLFYFGKPEEFEKRWRYSMFLDRAEGVNSLTEATRELNEENMVKTLRRGAFVNVYNKYGNTALHSVARLGNARLVAVLIKHGADRSLKNAQNKTAEQLVPKNAPEAEKYAETEAVFEKYRNKKFRLRVPEEFPISSYHIYIENRTEDGLTSEFMAKFRSITSEEALATTTHCIVKTEDGDVLATDALALLFWVFYGVIIVKDSWMSECLKDEKEIEYDYKYLVEKVKFKGVVYENAVVPWTQAKAKGTMPFLYGVYAVVVMEFCSNLELLSNLITTNGGTMLDSFPDKAQFNQGSHPYLHAHLGPLFVIHDGKTPGLMGLKTDPMFSLFTEDEFIVFMLKREINADRAKDPINVIDSEH